MANQHDVNVNGEHHLAFGEHVNISEQCRSSINSIMGNNQWENELYMYEDDAANLSDRAWGLLGRYVANNSHMRILNLSFLNLVDSKAALLFLELNRSDTINILLLGENRIGADGIRSMVPFLKNSQHLVDVRLDYNDIGSEGFELLLEALSNRCVKRRLFFRNCNIDDISALKKHSVPQLCVLDLSENDIEDISSLEEYTQLQELYLESNNLGGNGCMAVSMLVRNENSSLVRIDLDSSGMGNEEAKILADSLKSNTVLEVLSLHGNEFDETGYMAFLKILNDVSSIEGTHYSNHALKELCMPNSQNAKIEDIKCHIDSAVKINKEFGQNAHAAGRAKVISTQLNSDKRKELSNLQGVDHAYGSRLAGIDPILLPDILTLVGEEHGQDEVYRMLVSTVPELASVINRRAALEEMIAEKAAMAVALDAEHMRRTVAHMHQTAALAGEIMRLNAELASIASEGNSQRAVDHGGNNLSRRKRRYRSTSF